MIERGLYRGHSDFQGSIDADGRLYDEMHQYVGRIVGNDVYDICNIKQGSVDDAGNVRDVHNKLVGYSRGNKFMEASYRGSGMSRGLSLVDDENHGWEYGALMILKKRNKYYSGEIVDDNYGFSEHADDYYSDGGDDGNDGYSGGEEENDCGVNESDDYNDDVDSGEGDSDGWGYSPQKTKQAQRKQTRGGGNGRRKSGVSQTPASVAAGCFDAITSLVMIIVVIVMICNLIKCCWNGEIHF